MIGACLAPTVNLTRLVATLLAFFCAVGLAAHSLDELNGRPLGTHIPSGALIAVTAVGLAAAIALGIAGVSRVGWALVPFLVLGPVLVVAYNLELSADLSTPTLASHCVWIFPVLVAYVAQTGRLAVSPVVAAAAAFALSAAQRQLSTPARLIRRRTTAVEGHITLATGDVVCIDHNDTVGSLGTSTSCHVVGSRASGDVAGGGSARLAGRVGALAKPVTVLPGVAPRSSDFS